MTLLSAAFLIPRCCLAQLADQNEELLIAVLQGNAPFAEKDAACARLRQVGTEKCVAVLAPLLLNPDLSHSARFALTAMPYAGAGEALLRAWPDTSGEVRAGLAISLGERRQQNATEVLAAGLGDASGVVAIAAAKALGRIASPASIQSLTVFLDISGGILQAAVIDGILAGADAMVIAGKGLDAIPFYQHLTSGEHSEHVRLAAYCGILRANPGNATQLMIDALAGPSGPAQRAALSLIPVLPGAGLATALGAALPKFPPLVEAAVINGLAQRGDRAAGPAIGARTATSESLVRAAALKALGMLGDARSVKLLLAAAVGTNATEVAAARLSLAQLSAQGVGDAIKENLRSSSTPLAKAEAARALAERGDASALPALVELSRGTGRAAEASMEALTALSSPADLAKLVQLVVTSHEPVHASATAGVIRRSITRWLQAGQKIDATPLAQGVRAAAPAARIALLQISGTLTNSEIRSALREAMEDADIQIRTAAMQGMSETTDPELAPDLENIARSCESAMLRNLATRAVVRLATENAPAGASPESRVEPLGRILSAPQARVEQARIALAGVAAIPGIRSLQIAEAALANPSLANEAAGALAQLAPGVTDSREGIRALEAISSSQASPQIKAACSATLVELLNRAAFLRNWEVSGPYRQESKNYSDLFSIAFPPELSGAAIAWKPARFVSPSPTAYILDLLKEWPGEQCTAYARTVVESSAAQPALLELGSDDGLKVWLNGDLVYQNNTARPIQPGSDKVKVNLKSGRNELLVKVTQNNQGWALCARLLSEEGTPLRGVTEQSR